VISVNFRSVSGIRYQNRGKAASLPRNRLSNISCHPEQNQSAVRGNPLRQSFTLLLEQAVSRLGSLELRLHDAERLPRREDGLTILSGLLLAPTARGVKRLRADHTAAPDMMGDFCNFGTLVRLVARLEV
jgi:hypothetical protein